jgi:catechol 2,3-dioxygenase-like lactoylglutathione lyase family enzyme
MPAASITSGAMTPNREDRTERFIDDLVQGLDSGAIDRREFCQAVALAAAVYGAGEAAQAQASRGFKIIGVNHISYACPDYSKARDWYASVLNMKSEGTRDDGKRANMMFGPEPGKGGSFLVARTEGNMASGSATSSKPEAVIDHICYTVANWDEARIRATLQAKGLEVTGRDGSLHVYDPFNFDVQLGSAVEENAFRR